MTAAQYTITTHLDHLKEFIKKLERYHTMIDQKKFLNDEMAQDALLKALEQVTEAIITVATMIVAEYGFEKAGSNEELFVILGREKVYPKKLAEDMKGLGGFRNILVHDYIDIDLPLVYRNIKKGIPTFKSFARYVAKHIA